MAVAGAVSRSDSPSALTTALPFIVTVPVYVPSLSDRIWIAVEWTLLGPALSHRPTSALAKTTPRGPSWDPGPSWVNDPSAAKVARPRPCADRVNQVPT